MPKKPGSNLSDEIRAGRLRYRRLEKMQIVDPALAPAGMPYAKWARLKFDLLRDDARRGDTSAAAELLNLAIGGLEAPPLKPYIAEWLRTFLLATFHGLIKNPDVRVLQLLAPRPYGGRRPVGRGRTYLRLSVYRMVLEAIAAGAGPDKACSIVAVKLNAEGILNPTNGKPFTWATVRRWYFDAKKNSHRTDRS